MTKKNETLYKYFKNNWKPNYDSFIYSGWKLLDKIKDHENVLDVGCGYNLFKSHLGDRLYGIDPANENADEIVSIEEFISDKTWDVILCLGSLNFGTAEDVEPQVEKVTKLIKRGGRIYWRQNPGIGDHPWKDVDNIQFFPWTFKLNYSWANKYNCHVKECKWDSGNRLYAEWIAR